jgi:hypothetical protein
LKKPSGRGARSNAASGSTISSIRNTGRISRAVRKRFPGPTWCGSECNQVTYATGGWVIARTAQASKVADVPGARYTIEAKPESVASIGESQVANAVNPVPPWTATAPRLCLATLAKVVSRLRAAYRRSEDRHGFHASDTHRSAAGNCPSSVGRRSIRVAGVAWDQCCDTRTEH